MKDECDGEAVLPQGLRQERTCLLKRKPSDTGMPNQTKSIALDSDCSSLYMLKLNFPDPELNEDIVSKYSSEIDAVHFSRDTAPRFCYVFLKKGADVEKTKEDLSRIRFGTGFISASVKRRPASFRRGSERFKNVTGMSSSAGGPFAARTSEQHGKSVTCVDTKTNIMHEVALLRSDRILENIRQSAGKIELDASECSNEGGSLERMFSELEKSDLALTNMSNAKLNVLNPTNSPLVLSRSEVKRETDALENDGSDNEEAPAGLLGFRYEKHVEVKSEPANESENNQSTSAHQANNFEYFNEFDKDSEHESTDSEPANERVINEYAPGHNSASNSRDDIFIKSMRDQLVKNKERMFTYPRDEMDKLFAQLNSDSENDDF